VPLGNENASALEQHRHRLQTGPGGAVAQLPGHHDRPVEGVVAGIEHEHGAFLDAREGLGIEIRAQQVDEGADRLRHDAHLADLEAAALGSMAPEQRIAQRLPASWIPGLLDRQPGDQALHDRAAGEHQGRRHQRPVGGRGGIVRVQRALPALQACRLDGRRPALCVDIDHNGVLEAARADALAETVQGRGACGANQHLWCRSGLADGDLQVRVAHIQADDGHPALSFTGSTLAVHKRSGNGLGAALPRQEVHARYAASTEVHNEHA
jgi:hypothetical protein